MVLCGKAADGSSMELVEPPDGVPVGDRVLCVGHDGEPENANTVTKKKIWEKVAPSCNTVRAVCRRPNRTAMRAKPV
jgi:aminoacyl tRNA synthase complex-interacting multifunctional protein 1